jgi:lipopolysaccharide/colanic/teichoic acid biosynthesis glycosyltransferase
MMPSIKDRGGSPRKFQLVVKRLIDITSSVIALIVLSPLLLLVSLAIKIDSRGPILANRVEHCYYNQNIRIFKFRCSTFLHPHTRIGPFLIRNGLDRLPMLINVLRGEMSIVGPRCHTALPSLLLSEHGLLLLKNSPLKPGLFNPRESSDEYNGDSDQRQIESDISYIMNWSLFLDAKIFIEAIFSARSYKLDSLEQR